MQNIGRETKNLLPKKEGEIREGKEIKTRPTWNVHILKEKNGGQINFKTKVEKIRARKIMIRMICSTWEIGLIKETIKKIKLLW